MSWFKRFWYALRVTCAEYFMGLAFSVAPDGDEKNTIARLWLEYFSMHPANAPRCDHAYKDLGYSCKFQAPARQCFNCGKIQKIDSGNLDGSIWMDV